MTVSPDVIGVIIALATLVGGLFAGIWALLSRQTAAIEAGLEPRFAAIDARFDRIEARLDRIEGDMTDLKIAVARLEGPPPRLVMPR